MKNLIWHVAGKESGTMEFIRNFMLERGFSPALAESYINAFYGTVLMMVVIFLHGCFLTVRAMKEIPEEELTEDNKEMTLNRLLDENWCDKQIYFLVFLSYVILFIANYFIITRL